MVVRLRFEVLFLILFALFLTNCRSNSGPTGPEISLNFGFDPPTIDPALATDPPTMQVDNLLFLPLVGLHEGDGVAEPALAIGWAVSPDKRTWEFRLRGDVSWVGYDESGKPEKKRLLSARDVVYSVRRLFDPRTGSTYAARFAPLIRNASVFNSADPRTSTEDLQKMANALGVSAKDEHTVQFVLTRPMSTFPSLAATWLGRIQPEEPIKENGISWTEPGKPWTSGPYMLESWDHGKEMVLRRNPFFFDAANVQIETLNFKMIPDVSSALDAYLKGDLDTTDPYDSIEGDQLARVDEDAALTRDKRELSGLCTQIIGFNTAAAPFDSVLARRAFSVGLNREDLVGKVFKGGQFARWFAPPGLIASPDISSTLGVEFNAPQARDLLDQSGWGVGRQELPQIEFEINSNDTFHAMATAASENWKASLNAIVHLNIDEWTLYLEKLRKESPNLFRMGYCAIYPDASSLYDLFRSGSEGNFTHWSNADYDKLIDQADLETDVNKRAALYLSAEKILIQDQSVLIPILWSTRISITNPRLQRTYAVLEGYEHIERWKVAR